MMKYLSVIAIVAVTLAAVAAAQQVDYAVDAVTLVRQFVKFEQDGGRLTAEGWRSAANRFFLKPEPASEKKEVRVVSDKSNVKLQTLTETAHATVSASFPVCWGKIDDHLRFHSAEENAPPGVAVLAGCWETYKLVPSHPQWFLDVNGEVKPFTDGMIIPGGMRIVDFPQYLVLNRSAAVRYVTDVRNRSKTRLSRRTRIRLSPLSKN